jgi:sugar phosphate isomerase/epimerase
MELSINTDYLKSSGIPSPYLRRIADAGFTHVHWCHHWNSDFLYSKSEIQQIWMWLKEYDLQLLDLHGSTGVEKNCSSLLEYEREAGVELVKNRIDMTAMLRADVVVMHHPSDIHFESFRKSLGDLIPYAKERGVRIAIENGNFQMIQRLLSEFDPCFLGFCYDSGHANLDENAFSHLEAMKNRLIAIHLNDNNGVNASLHALPFSGTVDWKNLSALIARSSYQKCLNLELNMNNSVIEDEMIFLGSALDAGLKLLRILSNELSMLSENESCLF